MIREAGARPHPGRRQRLLGIVAALCVFQASAIRGATFVRGDTDTNGATEITDPVRTLNFLFLGSPASLDCDEAADSNDDGMLDIADGVFTLAFLFSGGPAPPAPFPGCGEDSDNDLLTCGGHVCLQHYTSTGVWAAGERALVGSTRDTGESGGDSVRVTALGCR